mmetsp:Transcript_74324/g.131806  ORF Transcript_74324/g.131806 Transcript_74324/m.131806 type:complete len:218 (+) Transcript_74324:629-1282(+)
MCFTLTSTGAAFSSFGSSTPSMLSFCRFPTCSVSLKDIQFPESLAPDLKTKRACLRISSLPYLLARCSFTSLNVQVVHTLISTCSNKTACSIVMVISSGTILSVSIPMQKSVWRSPTCSVSLKFFHSLARLFSWNTKRNLLLSSGRLTSRASASFTAENVQFVQTFSSASSLGLCASFTLTCVSLGGGGGGGGGASCFAGVAGTGSFSSSSNPGMSK